MRCIIAIVLLVLCTVSSSFSQVYDVAAPDSDKHEHIGNIQRVWLSGYFGAFGNKDGGRLVASALAAFNRDELVVYGKYQNIFDFNLFGGQTHSSEEEYSALVGYISKASHGYFSCAIGPALYKGVRITRSTSGLEFEGSQFMQPSIAAQVTLEFTLWVIGYNVYLYGNYNRVKPFGGIAFGMSLGKLFD